MKKLRLTILATAFIVVPFSCTVDEKYNGIEDLSAIDTEVSLFTEDGLSFPLGSTDSIKIKNLISKISSEDISKFLTANEKGEYSLNVSGSYDLSKQIADLDLQKVASFDGFKIEKDFTYDLGNIDKSMFNIPEKIITSDLSSFAEIDFDLNKLGIQIPTITKSITFNPAEFMPGDMQIPLTDVCQNASIGQIGDIKSTLEQLPDPISDPNAEINVQPILEMFNWHNKELDLTQNVSSEVNLGEKAGNIKSISNIALKPGAKITVSLEVKNCILLDGTVTPKFILDMSGLLKFKDAADGKLDLSSLILNNDKDNEYKNSRDFDVSGLADGVLKLDGGFLRAGSTVSISGALMTEGAKSSKKKIEDAGSVDMTIEVNIKVSGLEIDSMDIEVQDVEYDVNLDDISLNLDSQKLPDELASVDLIKFDQSKTISLDLSATGNTGGLSIDTEMDVQFPQNISLNDNGTGKVSVKGDLADAPVHSDIVLSSLKPDCLDGYMSYSGNVSVSGKAKINGKFNTKNAGNGFSVTAKVDGTLGVSDFEAKINADKFALHNIDKSEDCNIELNGKADIGTFVVTFKGTPECRVNIDLPTLTGINILADNLSLSIPEFIKVDPAGIKDLTEGGSFNDKTNTFTFTGAIPTSLTIPIKSVEVTPTTDGDKTVIKGAIYVKGDVKVSGSTITKETLDDLMSSANVKVTAVIPSMVADKFTLKDDFKKKIKETYDDIVIVNANTMKDFPKELKSIEKLTLKQGTKVTFNIALSGLPSLTSGNFSLRDTKITLPTFMKVSDKGAPPSNEISMGNLILGNTPIVYSVDLVSLENINLEGLEQITGNVTFFAELYAEKPSIDLSSTLSPKITGIVNVMVGNGTTMDDPGKIAIEKINAKVDYKLDVNESLPLTDIPQELKSADICLDVNPVLTLDLSTNLGIPITGSVILKALIKDETIASVEVRGIELPYAESAATTKRKTFVIGKGKDIDADLGSVFRRIPDSLVVTINANVSPESSVLLEPSAEYSFNADYDVVVPLSFGSETSIKYETDIAMDHGISEYFGYAKAGLTANILSTLPIGLNLDVTFVDTDGITVPMLDADNKPLDGNAIKLEIKNSPNGDINNPELTPVDLFINPDLTKWDNKAKPIDKLHLKISAVASDGVSIKEDDFLKLEDLKIVISEITIDPRNLK